MAKEATGPRAQRITELLEKELAPVRFELIDDSHRHAGHIGRPRGPGEGVEETHFRLVIVSEAFRGVNRVARSRLVHTLLQSEFDAGLHALSLTLDTPVDVSVGKVAAEPSA
ncbi:BolA family transcriptional regulator [Acetobacter sacchari]|uniref:BolA family transcriptional regulator n=1 Tax=Acetobacter sacchari TaxID=2661687 RepID=A0ABS3LUK6_9PROT|nr:BolA family protein [Acetobacter sacchari]MBO1359584.1 BolA family transcriptional regulator [Acetobacter sacchari]